MVFETDIWKICRFVLKDKRGFQNYYGLGPHTFFAHENISIGSHYIAIIKFIHSVFIDESLKIQRPIFGIVWAILSL